MRTSGERILRSALLGAACLLSVGIVGYGPNQGVSDHHNLSSLTTGDDHTQYLPRSGSRGMTGALTGTSATFTGNVTAVVAHLTTLVLAGVTVTGGSAFFGTEHNTGTGAHTAITATSLVASAGVTGASLDISPTLVRLPCNNGVAVSAGKLNALVSDGLSFDGSKNITPSWGPVADLSDVSGVTSSAGLLSRFARSDHRHVHAAIASGDLHAEYVRAAGTRAFSGNQSFGGFQATSLLLENLATGSLPTPSSGDQGRAAYDTTTHAQVYDDGVTIQYLRAVSPGAGLTSTDSRGLRTLNVGAGTGISVNADSVQIDTAVVPQLSASNAFAGALNTFHAIEPAINNTYELGTTGLAWFKVYTSQLGNGTGSGNITVGNNLYMSGSSLLGSNSSDLGASSANPFQNAYVNAYYGITSSTAADFPAGVVNNRKGVVQSGVSTLSGAATTAAITFTNAYSNTNYSLTLTADANVTAFYSSKAVGGFTINISANAGTTHVDWAATAY